MFNSVQVAALLDSGSSINIMSDTFYNSLPSTCKSSINTDNVESVKLANNQNVQIQGTTFVKMYANGQKHNILVYVLHQTSHPLILGTSYLIENNFCIDFGNLSVSQRAGYVRCRKRITIPAHSEIVVWGKLPKHICYGYQGICENVKQVILRGIIGCKSVVTVSKDRTVPVKLLNPGNDPIVIPKGKVISKFSQMNPDCEIQTAHLNEDHTVHTVQHVDLIQTEDESVNRPDKEITEFLGHFNISDELSKEQVSTMHDLLYDNRDIFVTKDNPTLGSTDLVKHHIILKPDFKPKHQRPYRLTPEKREVLRHHLDELQQQGVITEMDANEDAPITSPIVLVAKRTKPVQKTQITDKESSLRYFRFCVDYRYLNSQSETFKYSIPNLLELTESFTERVPNFITSIDMSSGFFQMQLSSDSSKYTAFNTCFGTFKFKRVPMGLHTSPNSFQLLMDKILRGLTFQSCLCYLDDVLIFSETYSQHISDLQDVFPRFRQAGLKLNPQKCSFAKSSCIFLGHHISKEGIRPPPDRVNALVNYPSPRNVKQLRRALGLFNWFKKYIPNYSIICEPLTRLLRKNVKFTWTAEQEQALKKLKNLLLNSEILAFPRFDLPFYLAVDSSSHGIGYVLYQKHTEENSENKIRVIRFGSKALTSWQRSYGPTKLELLGVVTSIVENSSYLRGSKFILECDHQALRPLFQNKFKGAIYDRWLAVLQQYNFEIRYKPASEMQVADALSRCMPDTCTINVQEKDSPDESDPYFPYIEEKVGNITFHTHDNIRVDSPGFEINAIQICDEFDSGYLADTENEISNSEFCLHVRNDCISDNSHSECRLHARNDSEVLHIDAQNVFPQDLIDFSDHNGNDCISNDSDVQNVFSQDLIDFSDHSGNDCISVSPLSYESETRSKVEVIPLFDDLIPSAYVQTAGEGSESRSPQSDQNPVRERNYQLNVAQDNVAVNNNDQHSFTNFDPVGIDRNSPQTITNVDLLCFQSPKSDLLIDAPIICDAPVLSCHEVNSYCAVHIEQNKQTSDNSGIDSNSILCTFTDKPEKQSGQFVCALDTNM